MSVFLLVWRVKSILRGLALRVHPHREYPCRVRQHLRWFRWNQLLHCPESVSCFTPDRQVRVKNLWFVWLQVFLLPEHVSFIRLPWTGLGLQNSSDLSWEPLRAPGVHVRSSERFMCLDLNPSVPPVRKVSECVWWCVCFAHSSTCWFASQWVRTDCVAEGCWCNKSKSRWRNVERGFLLFASGFL